MKRTVAAALFAVFAASPVLAQDAPDNPVLATVNGKEITASDVAFAVGTLGTALQRVPAAQRPQVVLDLMVDMELLADAAEKAGLTRDPVLEQRLAYYRSQTLRDLYMEKVISEAVTDEAVRTRYEEEAANAEPEKEVSASHILVETEDEAKAVIERLNNGDEFAEVAREVSKDPGSAARGGSLGFFGRNMMVPAFEQAAFALEEGATTDAPVQSRFGFHVIKVDEVREKPVPTFEEAQEGIRQVMTRDAFLTEIRRLRGEADIQRMSPPAQ